MRLYLDTNIIYKLFDKLAELVKLGSPLEYVEPPQIISFLYYVKGRHKYYVSNITKAEIFRYLHSSLTLSKKNCFFVWRFFKKYLNVVELRVKTVDFDVIADMLAEKPAKKNTLINLQHLMVSKEKKINVLTGDKPLADRFKIFYERVMSYVEFRHRST